MSKKCNMNTNIQLTLKSWSYCNVYTITNILSSFLYVIEIVIPFFFPSPHILQTFPHLFSPRFMDFFSLFRKGQDSHGYQLNMVYQVAARLRTSSCIKAWQGNSVWGIRLEKPTKESETTYVHTVRSPTRRPSYTVQLSYV